MRVKNYETSRFDSKKHEKMIVALLCACLLNNFILPVFSVEGGKDGRKTGRLDKSQTIFLPLKNMNVQAHYDNHLGDFYSWMMGDFETKQKEFGHFLEENNIFPNSTKTAIDLGAGNGIQSVALAARGFEVKAIDFNKQLLAELARNRGELPIEIIEGDIRAVKKHADENPELIVCCGDTLTHLENLSEIEKLFADCAGVLANGGKLILSFRDYSSALTGDARFIPVKADETRILTCCLDYETERVRVTDLLYSKNGGGWTQKVSSYYKVRVSPPQIEAMLKENGLKIVFSEMVLRLHTIIAEKI